MVVIGKIVGASTTIFAAFIFGGFIMGVVASIPYYLIFLRLFQFIKGWREKKRGHKNRWKQDQ